MSEYYDLGSYHRPVTTSSPDAQLWFDRGLLWSYGFHHEEAVRCFRRASAYDPDCAMARWGVAYALGCNYNKAWEAFDPAELEVSLRTARVALDEARDLAGSVAPVERALIGALRRRAPSAGSEAPGPAAFSAWNDAYADAMREVHAAHPDDADVCALFADALINRTPWQLWDLVSGEPAVGADTLEAVEVLEAAIAAREAAGLEPHPGLLHVYLHAMEMSPRPERALRAADALRDLVPDAGHLRHMPSHIDILCGNYHDAVVANRRAIEADAEALERDGAINFYTLYRCHDYHFLLYAAMFLGQFRTALDAAEAMVATLPDELLRVESPPMADWLEGFVSMKQHVLVRFGRWREILDAPLPRDPELYCLTTAVQRYARTVALAALERVREAEREAEAFERARAQVPGSRTVFNNTGRDILGVAAAMLRGEVAYRRGDHHEAFEHLREAVRRDDALPYDEPWAWMQPARHALGALLLEQGRLQEAKRVYRDDLGLSGALPRPAWHVDNVWSLHGYAECLHRLHEHDEARAVERRLALASARADVPIRASCYCRLETA